MERDRQFIVRDFKKEHLVRKFAYPEGFLPTDQSGYNVHQELEEITPDLLLSLLDELPGNFCDVDGFTHADIVTAALIKNIEKLGKAIISTELSVSSGWSDSNGVPYPAKVTLIAHIFFPGIVSVVDQANILQPFSARINWETITNNAAKGIVAVEAEDPSVNIPVTITLPKTRIATEDEHRASIVEGIPIIQRLTDMQGQRFMNVTEEMPGLVQGSQNRPGRYMITTESMTVSNNEEFKRQVLEYQKYFGKFAHMAKSMAIEIAQQNRIDTESLAHDIVSGILLQQPGVYSDTNILSFFKQEQK